MARKYTDRKGFELGNEKKKMLMLVQINISCEGIGADPVLNIIKSVDDEFNRAFNRAVLENMEQERGGNGI